MIRNRSLIVSSLLTAALTCTAPLSQPAAQGISRTQENDAYTLGKVVDLFKEQDGRPLYFATQDSLVRVRYAPADERLLIDIIKEPSSMSELRELSREDLLVKKKLSGNFDASLMMMSCGRSYGDDSCDEFSPIHQPLRIGDQIEPKDKAEFSHYLQLIGKLLNARRR